MPVQTGFGILSLGRDVTVDVVLRNGQHLVISNITGFDAKPKTKELESMGIDGQHRFATLPQSWTVTFEVDRENNLLDDFFAAVEENYFNGRNIENCTITQVITEGDGSLSTYRFEGCALRFEDAGNWKADAFVKMKLAATCGLWGMMPLPMRDGIKCCCTHLSGSDK